MMLPVHPLTLLERNVTGQLQASKEIFDIVLELTNFAEKTADDAQKAQLEPIMRRLLTLGEKLSQEAESTGQALLNLINSLDISRPTFASPADQRSASGVVSPYSKA